MLLFICSLASFLQQGIIDWPPQILFSVVLPSQSTYIYAVDYSEAQNVTAAVTELLYLKSNSSWGISDFPVVFFFLILLFNILADYHNVRRFNELKYFFFFIQWKCWKDWTWNKSSLNVLLLSENGNYTFYARERLMHLIATSSSLCHDTWVSQKYHWTLRILLCFSSSLFFPFSWRQPWSFLW